MRERPAPATTVADMRNLGPFMRQALAEIDIVSEADLRAVGALAAFVRLRFRFGRRITYNALWGMEAALAGTDWRDLSAATKARLRAEAEAALQRAADRSGA